MRGIFFFLFFNIILFSSCTISEEKKQKQQFKINYIKGKRLYNLLCKQCHKSTGEGFKKLYPPIKDSDFLIKNKDKLVCYIKFGISEKIKVNDHYYNLKMPANPNLSSLELLELLTFVYLEFLEEEKYIEIKDVQKMISNCR